MTSGRSGSGKILVVGSSNTDLVCLTDRLPRPGETVASSAFHIYPGGKAANQAVAAARAGARVSFVGAFGTDEYGTARRNELASEGIDVSFSIIIDATPSGLALIIVDRAGQNQIVTVAGANDHVTTSQIDRAIEATRPDVILFPNEAPAKVIDHLAAQRSPAVKIFNAAPYQDRLGQVIEKVDVLICNETEAGGFLGRDVTKENEDASARILAGLARERAVITVGDRGAISSDAGAVLALPTLDVEVVDTTGAGDAFCGVLAAWIAQGQSFESAVSAGVVAGALAVTRAGAQPSLPSFKEISAKLNIRG